MDQVPETPPANADDWSNQQWIEWLQVTDAELPPADEQPSATTLDRLTRSAGGRLLGNAMTGLAQALYGPQEEKPAIVIEAGEPEADHPLEVHLDFDHPERSFAVLRRDSEAPK
jgi:hypothetical protein